VGLSSLSLFFSLSLSLSLSLSFASPLCATILPSASHAYFFVVFPAWPCMTNPQLPDRSPVGSQLRQYCIPRDGSVASFWRMAAPRSRRAANLVEDTYALNVSDTYPEGAGGRGVFPRLELPMATCSTGVGKATSHRSSSPAAIYRPGGHRQRRWQPHGEMRKRDHSRGVPKE